MQEEDMGIMAVLKPILLQAIVLFTGKLKLFDLLK